MYQSHPTPENRQRYRAPHLLLRANLCVASSYSFQGIADKGMSCIQLKRAWHTVKQKNNDGKVVIDGRLLNTQHLNGVCHIV